MRSKVNSKATDCKRLRPLLCPKGRGWSATNFLPLNTPLCNPHGIIYTARSPGHQTMSWVWLDRATP